MKRLYMALFILGALTVPFKARGQDATPVTLYTLDAVTGPDSIHVKCVPFLGEIVSVIANQLYKKETTVTAMWADSTNNAYMIELDNSLRLFNIVEQCASTTQDFYAWLRIEGRIVTTQPVLVFPNGITRDQEEYFLKEASMERDEPNISEQVLEPVRLLTEKELSRRAPISWTPGDQTQFPEGYLLDTA